MVDDLPNPAVVARESCQPVQDHIGACHVDDVFFQPNAFIACLRLGDMRRRVGGWSRIVAGFAPIGSTPAGLDAEVPEWLIGLSTPADLQRVIHSCNACAAGMCLLEFF